MMPDTLASASIQRASTPVPLRLAQATPALSAVLNSWRTARCGGTRVVSRTPIAALCAALQAEGQPDSAMQVRDRAGRAVCFVGSIHQVAIQGAKAP